MLKLIPIIFTSVLVIACKEKKEPSSVSKAQEKFTIQIDSIKVDTPLVAAVPYGGNLLCLNENETFWILDDQFHLGKGKAQLLDSLHIREIFLYRDSIILIAKNAFYLLEQDFQVKPYTSFKKFMYGIPYYTDSTYMVTGCSVGEFGSRVSFISQKDGRHYSLPSNSVQQVLKHQGKYIVCCYLAHLSGFSSFLEIDNPKELYELRNDYSKKYCNWQYEDSILNLEGIHLSATSPKGVTTYLDTSLHILSTFSHQGELYTIYCDDSATYLGQHVNRGFKVIDTIRKFPLDFYSSKTINYPKNTTVTTFNWGISSLGEDGSVITNMATGLIIIKGNQIHFIDCYGIKDKVEPPLKRNKRASIQES